VRFLLDTDTISFALRGQGGVADELRRRSPSEVCTSSVVAGELELGVARRGSRNLRRELEGLYSGLEVLPYDREAARRYGRLAAVLLDEGRARA
jgi:predicted nucleic acid-binding protein